MRKVYGSWLRCMLPALLRSNAFADHARIFLPNLTGLLDETRSLLAKTGSLRWEEVAATDNPLYVATATVPQIELGYSNSAQLAQLNCEHPFLSAANSSARRLLGLRQRLMAKMPSMTVTRITQR